MQFKLMFKFNITITQLYKALGNKFTNKYLRELI